MAVSHTTNCAPGTRASRPDPAGALPDLEESDRDRAVSDGDGRRRIAQMITERPVECVVDLTDPSAQVIYNMTVEEARRRIASGAPHAVREIEGSFALLGTRDRTVYLARSLDRPLRYFVAKRGAGPCLVAAERIDRIAQFLHQEGLADQFHPSYTRMVPAHYVTRVHLVGCPDPAPVHERFFPAPDERQPLPPDLDEIGRRYVEAVYEAIVRWLQKRATSGPIGVCFSGGADSGMVFLVTYYALLRLGQSPARLKAFTLAVDGGGEDLAQARRFLDALDLGFFLEPIAVDSQALDWRETIRILEDYKPLDIEAATFLLALLRGIRRRYPDWRYLLDGDGGDENFRDYPIADNPELSLRSVLTNPLLYVEGWGVEALKHSPTYSGGLSRSYVRTRAPACWLGFDSFSPHTTPKAVALAMRIPFIELTGWDEQKLYALKGDILARGVRALTGWSMPVFAKRRFQQGAVASAQLRRLFPEQPLLYRRTFYALYET